MDPYGFRPGVARLGVVRSLGRLILVLGTVGSVAACGEAGPPPPLLNADSTDRALLLSPRHQAWQAQAPPVFEAAFETSAGSFIVEVHRDWAPHGADRFFNLVRMGYFDDVRFTRVVEGFIAQWGLHGDPEVSSAWKGRTIPDDPVRQSNLRSFVAFAFTEPGTRATQVFVSTVDNTRLDEQGFAPFGRVSRGMDVVDRLYAGYGEDAGGGVRRGNQGPIERGGNAYLDAEHPELDRIVRARVLPPPSGPGVPVFETIQEDVFSAPGALVNAFADFDGDGDPDIFVGFRERANRLYRNDAGVFVDVAGELGVADVDQTRAGAWGDYDGDGDPDLYVGFAGSGLANRLYRNGGGGRPFEDVTGAAGVGLSGATRQVAWVDYDSDGDLDLFVTLRDGPNALFRNDGGAFRDVAPTLGLDDPRRGVGAVWFDFDGDGDLDLYQANMDGDANALFRNDVRRFTDVAPSLGLDHGGRRLGDPDQGSVRPCLADFDVDGDLDLALANYGPPGLFRNDGDRWVDVAAEMGLDVDARWDSCAWGDVDNDGLPDLYMNGTVTGGIQYRDYLFRNEGDRFRDVTPMIVLRQNASHGVQWVDMDLDGALDLALAGAADDGMHLLLRNLLPPETAARSLKVMVRDPEGRANRAGWEVRIYRAGTDESWGTGLLDSGSGYDSQNVLPVHFGIPDSGRVDIEVTGLSRQGRVAARELAVDPAAGGGRVLELRVGASRTPRRPDSPQR